MKEELTRLFYRVVVDHADIHGVDTVAFKHSGIPFDWAKDLTEQVLDIMDREE